MKTTNLTSILVTVCCVLITVQTGFSQRTDHFTDEEIELIRFYQEIDKRMEIFVKAVNRRFLSIEGIDKLSPRERKQIEKDAERWGKLPAGKRSVVLADIEKIIDEAVSKIDDVASRNSKSDLFPNAVHILADAARTFITRLESIGSSAVNPREEAVIGSTIDICNDIIDASAKVKRPSKKKKKNKKKRS